MQNRIEVCSKDTFLLCSVVDVGAKRFFFVFPEGRYFHGVCVCVGWGGWYLSFSVKIAVWLSWECQKV